MGAFGGAYAPNTGNAFSDGASTASASPRQEAKESTSQQAPEGAVMPDQVVVPDNKEAPGIDIVDWVASILCAPGRAIVGQVRQPTMKDLPIILGVSALTWWLSYRYLWPLAQEHLLDWHEPKPKKKKMVEVEEEVETD